MQGACSELCAVWTMCIVLDRSLFQVLTSKATSTLRQHPAQQEDGALLHCLKALCLEYLSFIIRFSTEIALFLRDKPEATSRDMSSPT